MNPKTISISDFTYTLPNEKIAFHPLAQRDASRLLIYRNGTMKEDIYAHIDEYLPANSLLIFNNTRVIEARILFQKPTGGNIEIFCLEPDKRYGDITTAMLQHSRVRWNCLIGGASKWKPGQLLQKKLAAAGKEILLTASYISKNEDSFLIEMEWSDDELSFAELLHLAGIMPLPPYIKRNIEEEDKERYQTIYSKSEGSVAAPTAGLHFTEAIFNKLDKKNIQRQFVTLHVGAGTFKPVKAETMQGHTMHEEFIDVSLQTIQVIHSCLGKPITVVGTTSLRTVESLYWLGVKTSLDPAIAPGQLLVNQWDPYETVSSLSAQEALTALENWMKRNGLSHLVTTTQLLIAPGYSFRIIQALVTNFHQPESTLLLLVAALVGDDWRKMYDYALKNNFRFLSYGDGCLLQPRLTFP